MDRWTYSNCSYNNYKYICMCVCIYIVRVHVHVHVNVHTKNGSFGVGSSIDGWFSYLLFAVVCVCMRACV